MSFFAGKHTGVYSLNHRFTCRPEARQVLIYQCILDLTGENDKYNYSKAAHLYPPFSYIPCSAKNYKIAPALTSSNGNNGVAVGLNNVQKICDGERLSGGSRAEDDFDDGYVGEGGDLDDIM